MFTCILASLKAPQAKSTEAFSSRMKALLRLLPITIIAGFLVMSCGGPSEIPAPGTDGITVPTPAPATYTVPVTVTISGSVVACADQTCSTSQPLPGATVTLAGDLPIAKTTADASGNYSFPNIELLSVQGRFKSYTVFAAGTDASNTSYAGSAPVTNGLMSADNTSFTININTFPT